MIANPQTKAEIMDGIDCVSSKIYANNTVVYKTEDGRTVYRLHNTDIVTVLKGTVTLNTGGWNTSTTFSRINRILGDLGIHWRVTQRGGQPIIISGWGAPKAGQYVLVDGLQINSKGEISKKYQKHSDVQSRKNAAMLKRIDKYIDHIKKIAMKDGIPLPDSGDCWCCLLQTEDGKTMGDMMNDDHILMHMKEKYVPGALIWNAMKEAGYNPQYHLKYGPWTEEELKGSIMIRSVKKYIKRRVGLAP